MNTISSTRRHFIFSCHDARRIFFFRILQNQAYKQDILQLQTKTTTTKKKKRNTMLQRLD